MGKMIPQFILDNVFEAVETEGGIVYFALTKERDGWVVYWPQTNDTLHTYFYPPDFLVDNSGK